MHVLMLLSKGVQELCFQSKLELISLEKYFAFFFSPEGDRIQVGEITSFYSRLFSVEDHERFVWQN